MRVLEGKREAERGSGTFARSGPETAVMLIYDRAANYQTQTHSILLGGVKSFEGFVKIVQAGTVVPYLDQNGICVLAFRPNDKLLWTVGQRVQCLDSILQQVKDHLLQLQSIGHYGRQVFFEVGLHNNPLFRALAFRQTDDLCEDLI